MTIKAVKVILSACDVTIYVQITYSMCTKKAKMPNPEKYCQKMANSATLTWPLWVRSL